MVYLSNLNLLSYTSGNFHFLIISISRAANSHPTNFSNLITLFNVIFTYSDLLLEARHLHCLSFIYKNATKLHSSRDVFLVTLLFQPPISWWAGTCHQKTCSFLCWLSLLFTLGFSTAKILTAFLCSALLVKLQSLLLFGSGLSPKTPKC